MSELSYYDVILRFSASRKVTDHSHSNGRADRGVRDFTSQIPATILEWQFYS
jgi:hypothetical protein